MPLSFRKARSAIVAPVLPYLEAGAVYRLAAHDVILIFREILAHRDGVQAVIPEPVIEPDGG